MEKGEFIKSAMENYPEAGAHNSLSCTSWKYKDMQFKFYDEEEDKHYDVNLPMLEKGLKILLKIIEEGKYFNNGQPPSLLSDGYDSDSQDYDALVQCAIFGEVIYG